MALIFLVTRLSCPLGPLLGKPPSPSGGHHTVDGKLVKTLHDLTHIMLP